MSSRSAAISVSSELRAELSPGEGTKKQLFFLDDAQWEAIAVHLPVRQRGPKRLDDRLVISGILQVLQSGCAWRDCPREYGSYMTVFNRHLRWKKKGVWQTILDELVNNPSLRKLSLAACLTEPRWVRPHVGADWSQSCGTLKQNLTASRSVQSRGGMVPWCPTPDCEFGHSERMLAETEIKAILRTNGSSMPSNLIERFVEWHLRRATLISGTVESVDVIGSFAIAEQDVNSRLKLLISIFKKDYLDAKTRMIAAIECLDFYAVGNTDGGAAARKMLDNLLLPNSAPAERWQK